MKRLLLLVGIAALTLSIAQGQELEEEQPEVPQAMPLVDEGDHDILHILLIGSATTSQTNPGLTDTLMIVSINRDTRHVAVLSVPRDLHVYVPGFDMQKVNQAYFLGEMRDPEHTGVELLQATIRHNLGIEVDYYARVDFLGFADVIDHVGGIDIAVDCTIEDWRLLEPHLDPQNPDNWEMYTLWSGVHHMSGDTALWYVRSRRTSNDLDRNRRQQDVLRALWRTLRADGLVENFPSLWQQFNEVVKTDLPLAEAVSLLPIVADLSAADVEYFHMQLNQHVRNGYTTDEGRFILEPQREALMQLVQEFVAPSTRNRIPGHLPTVALHNGSGFPYLQQIAAQRLEREGFLVTIIDEPSHPRHYNRILDHVAASKGSALPLLQRTLRVTDEGVAVEPDPNRTHDFSVYIGANYMYYACTFPVQQPVFEIADEADE